MKVTENVEGGWIYQKVKKKKNSVGEEIKG